MQSHLKVSAILAGAFLITLVTVVAQTTDFVATKTKSKEQAK